MNEHITALNLVLNEVQPKFSSLLRRASKLQICLVKLDKYQVFHELVISALILVASFARPKISSQFLRVNESFKIYQKA